MVKVNKSWCMSSFLTFRYIANKEYTFREDIIHKELILDSYEKKCLCKTVRDIENSIRDQLKSIDFKHTAILLSGGMDSGILASYLPKGVVAYTVNNPSTVSKEEVSRAKRVCEKYGLIHKIVDVSWQDYENCIDILMKHDGCPVFANEPQVYALSKQILNDGFTNVIIGDSADMVFGGMDKLLSKDWTFDEWVERYTFVKPEKVLKSPADVTEIYERYRTNNNGIDFIKFLNEIFTISSSGAYVNAFNCLGLNYLDPYARLQMADKLDLDRVRSGDSKYMLRELYRQRFPGFEVPEKIAMVRSVDIWLSNWKGPEREEFISNCVEGMTGEQKFMVYSLERFLNLMNL